MANCTVKKPRWYYKGYTTGTNQIDMSSVGFEELALEIYITHDDQRYSFSKTYLKDNIASSGSTLVNVGGFYVSANLNCAAAVTITSDLKVNIRWVFFNGTNEVANATMKAFYR